MVFLYIISLHLNTNPVRPVLLSPSYREKPGSVMLKNLAKITELVGARTPS